MPAILRLLVAFSLALAVPAHAERVLEKYDVDSLSAMSKLIVKVEVGDATESTPATAIAQSGR